jgi:hypothetical protein
MTFIPVKKSRTIISNRDRRVNNRLAGEEAVQGEVRYRQHWLPWVLLLLSWVAMGAYLVFSETGL